MKVLYEARVESKGGRAQGHVRSSDGILDLQIRPPKELGGSGGATNPEQLFAAGYAACFESALHHMAKSRKINISSSSVTAKVSLGDKEGGGYQLGVKLEVRLSGVDKDQGSQLITEAHAVCPYSNATRGNIDVRIEYIPI